MPVIQDRHLHQRDSGCRFSKSTYQLQFKHLSQENYQDCYHVDAYRVWGHLYSIGSQNHQCMKDVIEHAYAAIADQHPRCHCHSDYPVTMTTALTTTTTTSIPSTKTVKTTTTTLPTTSTTTATFTTNSATAAATTTTTKPKPMTPAATTTKTTMATSAILQPTTDEVGKLFCRGCSNYFTSACDTSTFGTCTGSCMMIQKSGKLEMKCIAAAACLLQQLSDQLIPDMHTHCCTHTVCVMNTLQTAIQNRSNVPTIATTTQKYMWVSLN